MIKLVGTDSYAIFKNRPIILTDWILTVNLKKQTNKNNNHYLITCVNLIFFPASAVTASVQCLGGLWLQEESACAAALQCL